MGIMQTEAIFATLLAAAAFLKKPVQDLVTDSLRDAYDATKTHLRKRFGETSEAAKMLDLATAKPESLLRKALLVEESASSGLDKDTILHRLIERLSLLVPGSVQTDGPCVRVSGCGNSVQVAGRDLIHTMKHIQRNTITPDERHLSVGQRDQVQSVIAELAARLAGDDGAPNFAGAHRMLQRRYNVASYLLLPRDRFSDALAFLKQQRAITGPACDGGIRWPTGTISFAPSSQVPANSAGTANGFTSSHRKPLGSGGRLRR